MKNRRHNGGRHGYWSISLSMGSEGVVQKLVHRLMAEAFIPNPNNYNEINHINGNGRDNRIENLEWCTHQHNMQHCHDMGLNPTPSGADNHNAKLTWDESDKIKSEYKTGNTSYRKLAKKYNVSSAVISQILNNNAYKR